MSIFFRALFINFHLFGGLVFGLKSIAAPSINKERLSVYERISRENESLNRVGVSVQCREDRPKELRFDFTLLSYQSSEREVHSVYFCDQVRKYQNFIFGSLQAYWPLERPLGAVFRANGTSQKFLPSFASELNMQSEVRYLEIPFSDLTSWRAQTRAIAHEYGHVIFEEALLHAFKANGDLKRRLIENTSILDSAMIDEIQEFADLVLESLKNRGALGSPLTKDQFIGLLKKMGGINSRMAELRLSYSREKGFRKLPSIRTLEYYHEFFADLFTSFLFSEPNAVENAIKQIMAPGHIDQRQLETRMFEPSRPENFAASTWVFKSQNVHDFFTPTPLLLMQT